MVMPLEALSHARGHEALRKGDADEFVRLTDVFEALSTEQGLLDPRGTMRAMDLTDEQMDAILEMSPSEQRAVIYPENPDAVYVMAVKMRGSTGPP